MKKLISTLIALCLLTVLLTTSAFAVESASGDWGNLTWCFDAETDTLTISGQGEMIAAERVDRYPWEPYRQDIMHVVIEDGVTSLGGSVFRDYEGLRTVTVAGTVREAQMAFYDCDRLTEVNLMEGLTVIGDSMFANCPLLKTVNIPSTVTVIENGAFQSTALSEIELPAGLLEIGDMAFFRTNLTELAIPEGVTSIGEKAFYRCEKLETVKLPAACVNLGDNVFSLCTALKRIDVDAGNPSYCSNEGGALFNKEQTVLLQVPTSYEGELRLPDNLETIEADALYDCNGITAFRVDASNENYYADAAGVLYSKQPKALVCVPKSIAGEYSVEEGTAEIANYAFSDCKTLTKVTLPEGITEVAPFAFWNCEQLQEVQLPDTVTVIKEGAFKGCGQLKTVNIPDGVDTIDDSAFSGCAALQEIKLPKNLKVISLVSFEECVGLREISIPRGVETIDGYAFLNCKNLQFVFIPRSVENIERAAFLACTGLTDVFYEGTREEWERIAIGDSNDWLIHAKLHFKAESIESSVVAPTPVPTPMPTPRPVEKGCGVYAPASILSSAKDSVLDQIGWRPGQNRQSYEMSADTIQSGLAYENGMYVCVEGSKKGIVVQWYDEGFTLRKSVAVPLELPIYGGVYLGEDYNFVVCGQANPEERNDQEVIRVIRYSKDWQRQASASIYGGNTFAPFAFSAVRFARSGDMLYIHSGHEMFKDSDGKNHQANLHISVRISDVTIAKFCHWDCEDGYGRVSHSLNQFIIVDGDDVITLDQGDGNPRGLVLSKYGDNAGLELYARPTASGEDTNLERAFTFAIAENVGKYQYTGVEVGGFEASATHYLTAGVSCPQTGGISQSTAQQNVFVATMDKNEIADPMAKAIYYTDYTEENKADVSAPHLVKVSEHQFCLMWTVADTLYYCMVDGSGQPATDVFCAKGALSDCKPIVVEDSIVWYVARSNRNIEFFRIPLTEEAVHNYKNGVCVLCGKDDGSNPFTDVGATDWFYTPVLWAVEKGVTGGTSATTFSPDAPCTRAQVVTFLWAAARKPEPKTTENPFDDVAESDWFYKPVLWAVENGITGGTSLTTFSPDEPCTRAQVVTFLYAAAGKPNVSGGSGFADVAEDAWYLKPVLWAAENNVTGGIGDGKFGPDQTCTRSQVVTFLYKVNQ